MNNIIILASEELVPIPINHDSQRLACTLLTDDEIIIQVYTKLNDNLGKITTTFVVIEIKTKKHSTFEFQDEVFNVQLVDDQFICFLAYDKNYLYFLNYTNGEFNHKYQGFTVDLLFHASVNLSINQYRDLYFNQALIYAISSEKVFALLCDFAVLDKNEVMVCLQKNNQILQIYSYCQMNVKHGKMLLFNVGTKFIALSSIVQQSKLNFLLFNGFEKSEHSVQLQINEDTSVVKVFELGGDILFILNDNNFGNPWIVVIDGKSLNVKYYTELPFSFGANQFAVILDVFLINGLSLIFYYELNINGMMNEQFLQSVEFTDDLMKFKINEYDYIRFKETSISTILVSNTGYAVIPRAVEIGTIKQNYIDIDVTPISMQEGDDEQKLIERLNQESQIILYHRIPNIYCFAYHYMKHCKLFSFKTHNDFIQIGEEILKKYKER